VGNSGRGISVISTVNLFDAWACTDHFTPREYPGYRKRSFSMLINERLKDSFGSNSDVQSK
jgi:hypothetical protein